MSKWRILIVDDEEDVRTVLRATLSDDYEIVEAHDGLDALEKVDRYEPDFVLMDVMMPLMNGFDACAAIRKSEKFGSLPVMFLSALSGKEDMKKGYGAGANLYLTKPFEPSRLLKNIEVFFRTTPPPRRTKKFTIEEIAAKESAGATPAAPGSAEYILPMETPTAVEDEPVVATQSSAAAPLCVSLLKPRIMIVDDEPDILDLVTMTIGDRAEIVRAVDGLQAIERLVRYQPDVLVLDVMIPKMSGFQLTQSLRTNRAFARLPILVCSAKSSDKDIQFAQRMGANDFLPKPFTPEQLEEKLRALMSAANFRVQPKSITIDDLAAENQMRHNPTDLAADGMQIKESHKELESFLKHESSKSAFDRKDEDDAAKKKKMFFGFGKR